jgi:hypothetical protein
MITRFFAKMHVRTSTATVLAIFTVLVIGVLAQPDPSWSQATTITTNETPPTPTQAPTPSPQPDIQQTLQSALNGTSVPRTIRLKDMTSSWRMFQAGTADQQLAALGAYMAVLAGGKTPGNQYFTQGQVIMMGDTPYLVAYRMPTKSVDVASMLGPRGDFAAALPDIITGESTLTLSLLNLRTLGAIDNVQTFDINQIITDAHNDRAKLASALGARSDEAGVGYLAIISNAVRRATKDRSGSIPPMQSLAVLQRSLAGYISDHSVYTDPLTHRQFYTNPSLSNKNISDIADPSSTVVAYSDSPGADGLRAVGFLDGNARLVDVDEWASLQSSQQLP